MFSLRELGGSFPALDVSGLRPHTLVASGVFEELISHVLHLSEIDLHTKTKLEHVYSRQSPYPESPQMWQKDPQVLSQAVVRGASRVTMNSCHSEVGHIFE